MKNHINKNLQHNIEIHNKIANEYEKIHGEIYNEHEQSRLKLELESAIKKIDTSYNFTKVALDFGCGAGNLTKHLTNLGCQVISCDVSQGFLDLIDSNTYLQKVITLKLNGEDLSNVPDGSVDMVATYSVLHHVPDYLNIVKEFMRILKPGGVIYIDHEPSEDYWSDNKLYEEFKNKINKYMPYRINKYFKILNYYDWFIRKFINPRYHREGDIHVFKDDHVEWNKITNILIENGGNIICNKAYLLYRRGYNKKIYDTYKDKLTDMNVLVVKKII